MVRIRCHASSGIYAVVETDEKDLYQDYGKKHRYSVEGGSAVRSTTI